MRRSNAFRDVCAAELLKLRSLPAVALTIAVTLACTVGLAMLLTTTTTSAADGSRSAAGATLQTIPYAQIGFVLLGILTVASEYGGSQIRTTLVSMPDRLLVLLGKAVAYLATATVAAVAVVGTAFVAAQVSSDSVDGELGTLIGAVAYLVLIGLFAGAIATIARHLVAAVVAMAALVLVVSPLLRTVTSVASYFPDSAGMRLYQATDSGLTSLQGAAVLAGWLALAQLVAAAAFVKRDA